MTIIPQTHAMKSKKRTNSIAPADLARKYQQLVLNEKELTLDTQELTHVAEYYFNRSMFDEALKVVDYSLSTYPFATSLYLAKAKTLCALHLFEYAHEVLDQARIYGGDKGEICLLQARAYSGEGKHDDAFLILDQLHESKDAIFESRRFTEEAFIFEQMGRNKDAYYFLEKAIDAWPKNTEALKQLWISTELTGNYEETLQLCEKILSKDIYNEQAWYNLGHARYATRQIEEALIAFEYAYIIDPKFEYAYREAGEICLETKQYKRGVEIYESLMEYVCCDNEVLLKLGQCYTHTKQYSQARLCLNRVTSREPGNDEALYYSAKLYEKDNNYKAAVNYYRRAIAANKRNEVYACAMAEALVKLGDYLKAEHYFKLAVNLAPELEIYWSKLAKFLYVTGKSLEALQILDEAEEHTISDHFEFYRVALMMAVGKEPEALRHLANTLEENFEAHKVLFKFSPKLENHGLINQVIRCFA